jgi:hypothetical protein
METEAGALSRLPVRRYELARWKKAKVAFDYHVALDKFHYYSVPYSYAGRTVDVRSTSRTVEVFLDGERIACHAIDMSGGSRYTTNPEHMPQAHRAVSEWSGERFVSWASKTGENAKAYITALLASREHPEQAYKTCAGILRLASGAPSETAEAVCGEALAKRLFTYRAFSGLLDDYSNGTGLFPADTGQPVMHENIRGGRYYSKEAPNAE